MKKLFILLLMFAATHSYGQTTNEKLASMLAGTVKNQNSDTTLRVIYVDNPKRKPALFINGKYVMNEALLNALDPKSIENLAIVKRDTLIENISYKGQIYIKTKSDYAPKLITLTDLKTKYTDFKGKPVVFMLDGNFVNANYDNFVVDENNLLTIIVDKLQTEKEKIDLGLIKLLTKSKENIENRKQIILRGTEVSLNK